MSNLPPLCGLPCSLCKEFLFAPIISINTCLHHLHQKCFEKISTHETQCLTCKVAPVGTQNPKLEKLVSAIDRLARIVLNKHSSEEFLNQLLHTAIKESELEVVVTLINQGISPSILVEGQTPLYRACEYGRLEIATLLLDCGASAVQKNDLSYLAKSDKYWHLGGRERRHNATPMKAAVIAGNQELVNLLIKHRAPFDEQDSIGRSPLLIAISSEREELALFFIQKGADLEIRDHYGISVISMAVRCSQLRIVQELVKRGVPVNEIDEEGSTVLYDAANKNLDLLAFLLKNGAKEVIDVRWLGVWTPLSSATQAGNLENVKLLVEAGADLSLKYKGMTILELATSNMQKSQSYYEANPESKEEGDRIIANMESVIQFLQQAINQTRGASSSSSSSSSFIQKKKGGEKRRVEVERNPEIIALSDGTRLPRSLVAQVLFQIQSALNAAGTGQFQFLRDLQDKANKEDTWMPAPNSLCQSIELMKTHLLIDGRGHMLSDVKSIIKHFSVGEGMATRLNLLKGFSRL